jgi:transposase-like protein
MKTLNPAVARVLKRLHYPLDVILTCVRWYVAYPLSLRHLEDMMAERGVSVDQSTVHRWAIKLLPALENFAAASGRLARAGGWTRRTVRPASVARPYGGEAA